MLLNADSEISVFSVPDEAADNLENTVWSSTAIGSMPQNIVLKREIDWGMLF